MGRRSCSSALGEHRTQKVGVCAGSEELGRNWHPAGEERGKVCDPRPVHNQDALEASDNSWKERSLWQGRHGEGQASQDRGESIPCVGIEEGILSFHPMISSTLPVEKTRGATIRHG